MTAKIIDFETGWAAAQRRRTERYIRPNPLHRKPEPRRQTLAEIMDPPPWRPGGDAA